MCLGWLSFEKPIRWWLHDSQKVVSVIKCQVLLNLLKKYAVATEVLKTATLSWSKIHLAKKTSVQIK